MERTKVVTIRILLRVAVAGGDQVQILRMYRVLMSYCIGIPAQVIFLFLIGQSVSAHLC